jgi:predicted porin
MEQQQMKKALYGTTALGAIALMAGPAAAQDGKISLGVGGYYENFFTAVAQDSDVGDSDGDGVAGGEYNPFNVRQEGEIHFKGETTLDNGLTVGFQAQLEAITAGDQMDETYLYFEGGWGRLIMGSENSAPYLMQYAAPYAGLGLNDPNMAPYNAVSDASTTTYLNATSDANKVTYFTPRISGFQLGASYTPNIDNRGGNTQSFGLNEDDEDGEFNNFFNGGANFVQSFSGVDVAVAGGIEYGMAEGSGDDYLGYSGGLNIGFSGFTVGGSVAYTDDTIGVNDGTLTWDVGATYGAGPWEVGVTYLNGETETAGGDDQLHRVELGGNYRLSPGVKVVGALQYTNDEDKSANREEDAWGVILGTRLDF